MQASIFLALLSVGCDSEKEPKPKDRDTATPDSDPVGDTSDSEVDTSETEETGKETDDTETGLDDTGDSGEGSVNIDVAATVVLYSRRSGIQMGHPFALGDVTGDGIDDFCFLSRSGKFPACYGFRSPLTPGLFETLEADFEVQTSTYFQAHGDVNGDGIADLGIGNMVLLGPVLDEESEATADITVLYEGDDYPASYQANRGDSNGDGVDDYMLHLAHYEKMWTEERLYLFSDIEGPTILAEDSMANFFYYRGVMDNVGFLGDTNGDGYDEVFYGGNKAQLGPVFGFIEAPDTTFTNSSSGVAPVGDINGDGYTDAGTAAFMEKSVTNQIQIYLGPFETEVGLDAAVASIRIEGGDWGDHLYDVTSVGDLNGDSLPGIVFNYSDRDSGFSSIVYLFETPVEGALTDGDAAMTLQSEESRLYLTYIGGPADLQGDGSTNDFLIGDPYYNAYAPHGGVGWVMIGGTYP